MFTIIIGFTIALIVGYAVWIPVQSMILSVALGIGAMILFNVLFSRRFYKKLTELMASVERDIKAERLELALDKLTDAYKYQNWQLFLKKQLDSQIGSLLYARKRFDEAIPYLKNTFAKNWPAMCMLASYYYREKDYTNAFKTMDKTVNSNKKEAFPYSLYAHMLVEQGKSDKAI